MIEVLNGCISYGEIKSVLIKWRVDVGNLAQNKVCSTDTSE